MPSFRVLDATTTTSKPESDHCFVFVLSGRPSRRVRLYEFLVFCHKKSGHVLFVFLLAHASYASRQQACFFISFTRSPEPKCSWICRIVSCVLRVFRFLETCGVWKSLSWSSLLCMIRRIIMIPDHCAFAAGRQLLYFSLRLHHMPFVQCVDNWLLVNASCPNCRARCFELGSDMEEEKTPESGPLPRDSLVWWQTKKVKSQYTLV